jgi:hypothetical protein
MPVNPQQHHRHHPRSLHQALGEGLFGNRTWKAVSGDIWSGVEGPQWYVLTGDILLPSTHHMSDASRLRETDGQAQASLQDQQQAAHSAQMASQIPVVFQQESA